jgi:hypothetical protein
MMKDAQPYGYCQCGCGQKTAIADQTRSARGWVKGEPKRYVLGHAGHRPKGPQVCSHEGCEGKVLARGLCSAHYQQRDKQENAERYREYQERYDERHPGLRKAHARARSAQDPQKHKDYVRRSVVKRTYGLTLEEYKAILARGCAICGRNPGGRFMHLDHDHANGKVRDALCTGCNTGLGQFCDDPARLRAAADYLEKHA